MPDETKTTVLIVDDDENQHVINEVQKIEGIKVVKERDINLMKKTLVSLELMDDVHPKLLTNIIGMDKITHRQEKTEYQLQLEQEKKLKAEEKRRTKALKRLTRRV